MKRLPPGALVLLAALVAPVACTRAKAKTTPDVPRLEMPAPPPRDVETNETEPPPPLSLPAEPARNTPTRARPASPPPAPRAESPKVEAPKPDAAPPADAVKPPDEPKPPATTLQTTPAQAEGEVERSIRATLGRASADLNRIDYRQLNADARTQYDTAKSFVRQADAAMRAKNLVFAKNLADKAAALAAQLGGR